MAYDVCVMSGEDPLVIRFYANEEDYKDFNPSKIYVIAYRNLKEAYKKYRHLKQTYSRAEVELLREDEDKKHIEIVIDWCHETPITIVPDWRRELDRKIVNVYVKFKDGKVIVYGDTFHIKEELKKLGFKWDPASKAWVAPARLGVKTELENVSIPGVKVVVWEGE